jgi:hypothetical protein
VSGEAVLVDDLARATEQLDACIVEHGPEVDRLRDELGAVEADPAAHRHPKRTLRRLREIAARAGAIQHAIATARIRGERAAGKLIASRGKA